MEESWVQLASEMLDPEESKEMYLTRAAELEAQGKFKEAETLYIAINMPNKSNPHSLSLYTKLNFDRAISMYKEAGHYDNMVRLVKRFHEAHVQVRPSLPF